VILVDAGPLVAVGDKSARVHEVCVRALQAARPPRLVPGPVVAEVCYLLAREAGTAAEASFLRSFRSGFFTSADLTVDDLDRAAELVERYASLPLGGTDACVIAVAERLDIAEVATLDRRHFSVVRPRHIEAFTLVPQ
jgi:predicted nucleic acid-binding protein